MTRPARHEIVEVGTTTRGDDYLICTCRQRFTGTPGNTEWDQFRQHVKEAT